MQLNFKKRMVISINEAKFSSGPQNSIHVYTYQLSFSLNEPVVSSLGNVIILLFSKEKIASNLPTKQLISC